MLAHLIEVLVLPPASVLVLFLFGTCLLRWRRRVGRWLQALAVVWLWLAATPCVGGLLLCSLQSYPPLLAHQPPPDAQAIIVLAAGADRTGAEYGGAVIGPMTMQRLRYGAFLQRRTDLPMLVSGGLPASDTPTLAALMQQAAEQELGATVRWREDRSADTYENARYSAEILKQAGLTRVLLVTSAWHMPRAVDALEHFGLEVTAAPTGFRGEVFASWRSYVPHWSGLRDTCLAMHEWGGRIAYLFRD